MKRIFLGAAVAVMALLSACEAIGPQESEQPGYAVSGGQAGTQLFTATIGADTKTHLQYDSYEGVYKTVWSEEDYIYVINSETHEFEQCPIVEGAGTSTATFAGTIETDSYIAYFGSDFYFEEGAENLDIYLRSYQDNRHIWDSNSGRYLNMFGPKDFPMIAKSSTKSFEFQNICSVLKVSITGNGEYVDDIYFTPNDESISTYGQAYVSYDGDEPVMTFVSDGDNGMLWFDTWGEELSSTPQDYYIVLPSRTYYGGFTLEIVTYDGSKTVTVTEDIQMRRSRIRKIEIAYETEEWSEPSDTWGICGEMTDWTDDIPMEYEDGYFVARNVQLEAWQNFVFRSNGDWDGARYALSQEYYDYFGNNAPTNTNISVENGEWQTYYNMAVPVSGTYDLYLDVYNEEAFIMSAGVALDDIPTTSYVQGWNYDNLNSKVDGTLVKVEGYVMAKTNLGFILALDGKYQNSIYVYDKNNLLEHIELGNYVDVYAKKITYRGLAELEYSSDAGCWSYVLDPTVVDYSAEYAVDITDYISSYSPDWYQYVRVMGTLTKSGNYYNLVVDGATVIGSIISPVQDLTEYLDKTVCVEGYFCGLQTSGGVTYSNIALKRISGVDTEGSTPDVGVGGDIIVSSPLRMKSNR